MGVTHYDDPPPDVIEDLDALRDSDAFRFANRLEGWVEVEGGRIVDAGYGGGGVMGSTTVRLRRQGRDVRRGRAARSSANDPVVTPESRHVRADLRRSHRVAGAAPRAAPAVRAVPRAAGVDDARSSPSTPTDRAATSSSARASFPRHWVYDDAGKLAAKVGLADFKQWYRRSFGRNTPWGSTNSTALVTAVETALERELAGMIMRGGEPPTFRKLKPGALLTEQGQPGDEVFLVLDGVLALEVDGKPLAEFGPGAILGERAVLEGGVRTSTLRAVTKCRVAVARGDQLDREVLARDQRGSSRASDDGVRLLFCGVRGSTPAPGAEFVRVGGHTSCVALAHDDEPWSLLLDAGTGIRRVTDELGGNAVHRHVAADAPPLGPRAGAAVLRGR